ncbi:MAG: hypothetical protein AAFN77_21000 [Planctomycetota bacterium]
MNTDPKLKNQRLTAIETVVSDMSRFKQGRARQKLVQATKPASLLQIIDSSTQVKLTQGKREVTVPTNGQLGTIKGDKISAEVISGKRDGKLIVVTKTANATHTCVYQLSDDGQNLSQQVHIQSSQLSKTIRFTNQFSRQTITESN